MSQMLKDKVNQLVLNTQGQFIEVSDRSNIYQCMDLAELWVFILGFPKETIQHLYAYQVYTNPTALTLSYFDLIPNTPTFIPNDGDLTVFDKTASNIAGHIGVALGGGTTLSFRDFEQNYPVGTAPSVRLRDYNTPKLLGVLRPKIYEKSPLVITDLSTKLDFSGMTTDIETYGVLDFGTVKSKILAKDTDIKVKSDKINAARV